MAIGSCRLVGLDGTHGVGKTSAALALTSKLQARGFVARCVPEVVRTSPYFDQGTLRWPGPAGELDVFGEQIAAEQRAAIGCEVLICDRTVLSAIAYWQARVTRGRNSETALLRAAVAFARAYARLYDLFFLMNVPLSGAPADDGFRVRDPAFQAQMANRMRSLCQKLDVAAEPLPLAESPDATADRMILRIDQAGWRPDH